MHHWESAYIAPTFPVARGWERQLDVAYDPIFYLPGALTARSYPSWLLANGVSYVALPGTALDYAATSEASLLRSGRVEGLLTVSVGYGDHGRCPGQPALPSASERT